MRRYLPLLVSILFLSLVVLFIGEKLAAIRNPNRYYSKNLKLSFDTKGVNYLEKVSSGKNSRSKAVIFSGDIYFEAIEHGSLCKDYLDQIVACGEVLGNFEQIDTLRMQFGNNNHKRIIDLGGGIYELIQYTNSECSPTVDARLLVKPPPSSKIKMIEFWPKILSFEESDMKALCEPNPEAIEAKIRILENRENPRVKALVDKELEVARSFGY